MFTEYSSKWLVPRVPYHIPVCSLTNSIVSAIGFCPPYAHEATKTERTSTRSASTQYRLGLNFWWLPSFTCSEQVLYLHVYHILFAETMQPRWKNLARPFLLGHFGGTRDVKSHKFLGLRVPGLGNIPAGARFVSPKTAGLVASYDAGTILQSCFFGWHHCCKQHVPLSIVSCNNGKLVRLWLCFDQAQKKEASRIQPNQNRGG